MSVHFVCLEKREGMGQRSKKRRLAVKANNTVTVHLQTRSKFWIVET